jgi:spore germination cell wall hydrolase CwlJ-like protein
MNPIATKTIFLCLFGALIAFCVYEFSGTRSADLAAPRLPARHADRATVMPDTGLPMVEPLEFLPIAPEDAMAKNAITSKVSDPGPAAQPFFIQADNREAATNCLTSAVYYEAASDGLDGQRAVAQVVINRARHPAFPASICGVIYQGAERTTGCQFTFSCDGALARKPSAGAWATAKRVATAALNGFVYAPVGLATIYHTN